MADHSKIEWTEATWNPVTGCSVVSPGCTNCYAMRLAGTRLRNHPSREGLTTASKAGPVWNGEVRLNEQWLDQPLRWKRPRMIFVCAHGDLFHENVPDEWIDRVFAVMASAPQHTFQVLTKRSARMRAYFRKVEQDGPAERIMDAAYDLGIDDNGCCAIANWINGFSRWRDAPEDGNPLDGTIRRWPLPNVWLGVSAEDQTRADERIPDLLATPAAIRFVSAEPLLGLIDFTDISWPHGRPTFPETNDISDSRSALHEVNGSRLNWVILGGESGPGARAMNADWARSIRDQCEQSDTAFFMKQMAKKAPIPDDLLVRQFPNTRN